MYEVNLPYFLFGIMAFMIFRLIDSMKMFNPDFEAPAGYQKVFYYFFGMVFLLSAMNGVMFQLNLRTILPIIFLIMGSALFISDSFVKPSKNYLMSLCVGSLTGGILTVPFFELFHQVRQSFDVTTPYLGLIGIGLAHGIGLTVGILFYVLLYYKHQSGLNEVWDGTRVWRILNNKIFVLILWIIIIIETFLQLRYSTLVWLFY